MKKTVSVITAFVLAVILMISTMQIMAANKDSMFGDINGDGKITSSDARILLRCAARLDNIEKYQNDITEEPPAQDETPYTINFENYSQVTDFIKSPTVPQNIPEKYSSSFDRTIELLQENGIQTLYNNGNPLEPYKINLSICEYYFTLRFFICTEEGNHITVTNSYQFIKFPAEKEETGIKYKELTDFEFKLPLGMQDPIIKETVDYSDPFIMITDKYGDADILVSVSVDLNEFNDMVFVGTNIDYLK